MFVRGHTIAIPVLRLNKSLLTTKAGRRPFCSWPDWGSKVTARMSPCLGIYAATYHVSLPTAPPINFTGAIVSGDLRHKVFKAVPSTDCLRQHNRDRAVSGRDPCTLFERNCLVMFRQLGEGCCRFQEFGRNLQIFIRKHVCFQKNSRFICNACKYLNNFVVAKVSLKRRAYSRSAA